MLRAFLPLREQQARYNIGDYKGLATVLDSRVVCMRPELGNPEVCLDGNVFSGSRVQRRFALVSSSVKAPIAADGILGYVPYEATVGCLVDPSKESHSVWRISLCQTGLKGHGVPSQLKALESHLGYGPFGLPYLVLNVTSGSYGEWSQLTEADDFVVPSAFTKHRVPPVRHESNGEWLDLVFTDNGTLRISVTLCYAASETEDLFIHAYSTKNRTEPLAEYDTSKSKYRYDKVRRQLGQTNDGSWTHGMFESRGISQLQPRPSWHAGTHQGDYIRPYSASAGEDWTPYISWVNNATRFENINLVVDSNSMNQWPPDANYTAYLSTENGGVFIEDAVTTEHNFSSIYPDPSFSSLLQDILRHGGDIAHGLSSLITVQAGSTYYDQLPQFNGQSAPEQTFFELVLTPQRYRGYIAVVALASIHLILIATISFQFLTNTKISTIGNAWQTFAQIKDPWTEKLLDQHTLSSDREVNLWMRTNDAHVKLGATNSSDSMYMSHNEAKSQDLRSTLLKPGDAVGIRLASSGLHTELVRRDQQPEYT